MESKLTEFFRYSNSNQVAGGCESIGLNPCPSMSEEDLAKARAESLARENEYERRRIICAVIEIAQGLVVTQGKTVSDAFETAKELLNASKDFMDNFKL